MKFRSRTGKDIRVALTSGHTAIVGSEWRDLPEVFHSAAYSAGCISEDMVVNEGLKDKRDSGELEALEENVKFEAEVKLAIENAINDNNIEAFSKGKNPKPKASFLKDVIGKPVPTHIREKVWDELLDEGLKPPMEDDSDELKNDIT